jgi:hypothetical protein
MQILFTRKFKKLKLFLLLEEINTLMSQHGIIPKSLMLSTISYRKAFLLVNHNISNILPELGGTSAGFMVMGQYIFTAKEGGIDSKDALANPYDSALTIGSNFINFSPLLQGVIAGFFR